MSVSPKKRSSGAVEVVIYTKPKSPSKISAGIAREKAAQEEAEFAGLTRIEQIRLRARRKAEQEYLERQEAESRPSRRQRTAEYDAFDDDDEFDDLPDLIVKRVSRQATGSLKSSPDQPQYGSEFEGPLSSLTPSTDDISSSLSLPQSQSGPTSSMQRSRRTTARIEPYIFRPSLDPVSERRQKLKDAKESAAVQANVIKEEDFKMNAHESRSDAIEKVLRDHRREQRKGLDVYGLYATIKMAEGINEMMDVREEESREVSEGKDSESVSDDDTSVASSSRLYSPLPNTNGKRQVNFQQSLTEEEKERERRSFVELTGEENDRKDSTEMFDILLKDKEVANRKKQAGQGEEIGFKERIFWKDQRMSMKKVVFSKTDCSSAIYAMLRDASDSGQSSRLVMLLSSGVLMERIAREEESVAFCEIATWLLEVAIFTPTSQLSFVALQALHSIYAADSKYKVNAALAMLSHLPILLSKLGARSEILNVCFERVELATTQDITHNPGYVRRGERVRAVERLLQAMGMIVKTMKQEASSEDKEGQVQLFLLLLHLGIDPHHSELRSQIECLLELLLDGLLKDDAELESQLLTRLKKRSLNVRAPTTQLAIVNLLPNSNLRSRSFQRCLAYEILSNSTSTNSLSKNCNNYNLLANMFSSKSANINPLINTMERDYKQVNANVQLLCYAFNDFALQLLVTADDLQRKGSRPAKRSLMRVIQNYHDYDDESASFLGYFLSSPSNGKEQDWKVNMNQVDSIHCIIESLHGLSNQIHEGKGAFLDRSIVKDQLQRLRLMLLYLLSDFGLDESESSKSSLQQGKLSKWFK